MPDRTLIGMARSLVSVFVVGLSVALLGCAEDVPITTEPDRNVRELEHELTVGMYDWIDLLIVLDEGERSEAEAPVIAMVRQLITGDSDGDRIADHHALPLLRLAVVTPEQLTVLDACADSECPTQPKVATYHWQPYGLAPPSIDPFLDQVRCLLSDNTDACGDDDESDPGLWDFDVRDISQFQMTLDDVRAATEPAVFEARFLTCIADFVAWGPGAWDFDAMQRNDNGLPVCELRETLPLLGAITGCDQLADFGRSLDRVDDDGREVCTIQQLQLDENGAAPTEHGYYFDPTGATTTAFGSRPSATATPEYPLCGVIDPPGPKFLMTAGTPFIDNSTITLVCAFDVAE